MENTPSHYSQAFSCIAGCDLCVKFENFQFTASFKERGALNKLLALTEEERVKGVIAMSAGNHAQGVAYHAGRLNVPATVVVPEQTAFTKVKHTKEFGATVIVHGHTLANGLNMLRHEIDYTVFILWRRFRPSRGSVMSIW